MNTTIAFLGFTLALGAGCTVDTTKLGENAGSGNAGRTARGVAGGGSPSGGSADDVAGMASELPGSEQGGAINGTVGGAGSGGAGSGGAGSGGFVNAPKASDVCRVTKATTCHQFYSPGCIPADQLEGLKAQLGATEADCVAYFANQCTGFDCSDSENYSPANNQKCLDETAALTCDVLASVGAPDSCNLICDQ